MLTFRKVFITVITPVFWVRKLKINVEKIPVLEAYLKAKAQSEGVEELQ